jgi:hypothetical protein
VLPDRNHGGNLLLSAFELMQIAAAVFLGNLMTFAVVKGAQILDNAGESAWWKYFVCVVPVGMALLALIGSTG